MQTLLFLAFWFKKLPSQFKSEVTVAEYKVLKVALFLAVEKIAEFVEAIFGSSDTQKDADDSLLDVNKIPTKEKVEKMEPAEKEKLQENSKVYRMMKNGRFDKMLGSRETDLKALQYKELGFFDRIADNRRERLAEEAKKKNSK